MILTHELAHLRRRDHWVRGVELIVSVIYWWNPLVWAIRRQIHHAEDLCCDAWVRYAFPDCTKRYAEVVLKAAESSIASKLGARLLPASSFLHSLSLKARIEMILESRFAPSVSTRSTLAIALLALFVLPSFVETTKAEPAAGPNSQATARRPASPMQQRHPEFPYVVKFEQGATHFSNGDKITIVEARGTADTFTPRNIYWIRGTYTLASHDRATLLASVTARDHAEGKSRTFQPQTANVTKGHGTFTLFPADVIPGMAAGRFLPGRGRRKFRRQLFWNGRFCPETRVVGNKRPNARLPQRTGAHHVYCRDTFLTVGKCSRNRAPTIIRTCMGAGPLRTNTRKALKNDAKPGDTILLFLSPDTSSPVSAEFSDLLPLPWSEIESLLKQNQTVFRQGKVRGMNVFLLATPTEESLPNEFRRLVAEGKFTLDKETTTK